MKKALLFAGSLFLSFLPALAGVFFKPGTWYKSLNKPFLNPPGWVFGPVWTLLYFLMGLSLFMVYSADNNSEVRKQGLRLFFAQLFLNACWTPAFFGAQRLGIALFVLAALLATILACIYRFYQVKKIAGLILIPYFLWCCFAFYLNLAYYWLNS